MKIGLVGIEQSGVTTVFEGLSGGQFSQEKTGRRHTVVQVPDSRVDFLSKHFSPKKTTYIQVEFIEFGDITKSIKEARKGFGEYVAALRELDGIVLVLRDFETEYQLEKPDSKGDLEELLSNFSFADMDVMMKRIDKLEKSKNKPTKTQDQDKKELVIMKKCQELLENEEEIKNVATNEIDANMLKCFGFLTMKPLVLMVNIGENDDHLLESLRQFSDSLTIMLPHRVDVASITESRFDVVVLQTLNHDYLRIINALLVPGGCIYWEINRAELIKSLRRLRKTQSLNA